ncbi:MAG TPA: hypothetical protein VEC37_08835 [Bacillota bacterium]|nr:hypothetical protein [Bacillota bacterium]
MRRLRIKVGMLLFMVLVISTAGCFSKRVTGPTWTTKFSIPLIMRSKNTTESTKSSEILLGTGTNGIGEKGLNLINAKTYSLPYEVWESKPLGMLGMSLKYLPAYDLTAALNLMSIGQELVLPVTQISNIAFNDPNYLSATLSQTPGKNQIEFQLIGAEAGTDGLTFRFKSDSEQLQTAKMTNGSSSVVLSLAGKVLSPNKTFSLEVSGSLRKVDVTSNIKFVWSPFEAQSFMVSSNYVAQKVNYDLINEPIEFDFDLPAEFKEAEFSIANLQITPQMPENLTILGNLNISSNLGQSETISNISLSSTGAQNIDITAQLNRLLKNSPRSLTFAFSGIQLGGSGDVKLEHTDTVKLTMEASLGFTSVATTPQAMKVDSSIDTDTIETTTLVFEIMNYSPVALIVDVVLYPDNDKNPDNAPPNPDLYPSEQITFRIEITPGMPGRSAIEKTISTAQMRNLIRNGTVYHQLTVTNTSTDQPILSEHYLEIRSKAEGRIQVNKP